jgi:hypothetical protein
MLLKCLLGLVATLSYLRFFHRPWKSSAVGHVGTTVYASPWDRDSKVPSCMSMVHPQRFCSEMFRDAAQTIIAYHSYVYIYTHIVHISYIHISNHKQCLLDHTLKRTDMWWYVPRSRLCIANQLNGFSYHVESTVLVRWPGPWTASYWGQQGCSLQAQLGGSASAHDMVYWNTMPGLRGRQDEW